jgi:hypothetical protein
VEGELFAGGRKERHLGWLSRTAWKAAVQLVIYSWAGTETQPCGYFQQLYIIAGCWFHRVVPADGNRKVGNDLLDL